MYKNHISLNKSEVELIKLQYAVLVRQDLGIHEIFEDCFVAIIGKKVI